MIPRRIWAAIALAAMLALPVHAQSTAPTDQPRIMTGVVSGHDFGMAMTFDVYVPDKPNGGGWRSPYGTYKTLDAGVVSEFTVLKGASHDPTRARAEQGLAEALRRFESHLSAGS